jgi:gliding motility-associated-like protein
MRKYQFYIFIFFLCIWFENKAQIDLCNDRNAEKGSFTITPSIGIEPLNGITITDNSGGTNIAYYFNYVPGLDFNFVNNPAYGKVPQTSTTMTGLTQLRFEGTYQILQFGTKNGRKMYACRTLTILPAGDPEFGYLECNGNVVDITISDLPVNKKFTSFILNINGTPETINPTTEPLPIKRRRFVSSGIGTTINVSVEGSFNFNNTPLTLRTSKSITLSGTREEAKIQKIETKSDGTALITYIGDKNVVYDISTPPITIAGGRLNVNLLQKGSGNPVKLTGLNPNRSEVLMLYHLTSCGDNRLSNLVPAIFMTKATRTNSQAEIEWTTHPSISSYIVKREIDGVAQPNVTVTTNSYQEAMPCNKKYCYQVEAVTTMAAVGTSIGYVNSSTQTATSVTEKKCITPDKPAAILDGYVTVDNNKVNVEALGTINPPPTGYTFYRAENGTPPFTKIGATQPTNTFTDNGIDPSKKLYCYQFTYTNDCNRESEPSPTFCPVFLELKDGIKLLWTEYQEFTFNNDNIVKYVVEQLDNTGAVVATKDIGLDFKFDEDPKNIIDGSYRVKAISKNGKESYSNGVVTFSKPLILLPDAFTPNGDTENNELKVYGSLGRITDFKMEIYNRWGTPIASITDKSGTWDGTIDGEQAPAGIYVYQIKAKTSTGDDITKKGNVMLLR